MNLFKLTFLSIVLLFWNCQKEKNISPLLLSAFALNSSQSQPALGKTVLLKIEGFLTDENGAPIDSDLIQFYDPVSPSIAPRNIFGDVGKSTGGQFSALVNATKDQPKSGDILQAGDRREQSIKDALAFNYTDSGVSSSSGAGSNFYMNSVTAYDLNSPVPILYPPAETPTLNVVSGTYEQTFNLAILRRNEDAYDYEDKLYYTTDGTTPSCPVCPKPCMSDSKPTKAVGTPYENPFAVASSMTVKTIACSLGAESSQVTTADYVVTPNANPVDYALHFDGRYTRINIEPSIKYDYSFYTISAWIKPDAKSGVIFAWGSEHTNNHVLFELNRGNLSFTSGSKESGKTVIKGSSFIFTGSWVHVAVVKRGTGALELYLNGVLEKSGTVTKEKSPLSITTDYPHKKNANITTLGVGFINGKYQGNFLGQMDNVSIWNAELPVSQIADLYKQTPVGTEPGLVALYKFQKHTPAATLIDSSATGGYNGKMYYFTQY